MNTKNRIIATILAATLAISLAGMASAVHIPPTITFLGSDPVTGKWTYEVTPGAQPELSHLVIELCCEKDAITGNGSSCPGCTYDHGTDLKTGATGLKFEFPDDGTCFAEGSETIWFTLDRYYAESDYGTSVVTKSGNGHEHTFYITGPLCPSSGPLLPELSTVTLVSVGLLALAGSVGLRRRKD